MDFFYDGQVRRYVSQFMRIFIGFKYQTNDGSQKSIPVAYGDLTRQVASIIRDNSENKMPTVPRIACYVSGLRLDTSRLSDATHVSKMNIRERAYDDVDGEIQYRNTQGAGYTVERLMPTPFEMRMRCDIWSSNTDQKLQILEQILVMFNPSLEIQTTDNYIDWTSLSSVYLEDITFTSRNVPVGVDDDIDVCTLEFSMPIYITPPAKVKKLGIVKTIIANVFTEQGNIVDINDLIYNENEANMQVRTSVDGYPVILMKDSTDNATSYSLSVYDVKQLALQLKISDGDITIGNKVNWQAILELHGGYTSTSLIHFLQPTGYEITGTFAVNPADPTVLTVEIDSDTIPTNTLSSVDAIINPQTFKPSDDINAGTRYLILEEIGENIPVWGLTASANSIIEYDGANWQLSFDPATPSDIEYVQNQRTLKQYVWNGSEWLKSFEGEYGAGYWRFDMEA